MKGSEPEWSNPQILICPQIIEAADILVVATYTLMVSLVPSPRKRGLWPGYELGYTHGMHTFTSVLCNSQYLVVN